MKKLMLIALLGATVGSAWTSDLDEEAFGVLNSTTEPIKMIAHPKNNFRLGHKIPTVPVTVKGGEVKYFDFEVNFISILPAK